jgi:hypothetical protein
VRRLRAVTIRAGSLVKALLMPSTPFAYPQVISRNVPSFRVVKVNVYAGQAYFRAEFDSRLHRIDAGQD